MSAIAVCALWGVSPAEDWPTYGHDAARSFVTAEGLPEHLREVWVYRPTQGPRPAWPPPAEQDFWNRHAELSPAITYDRAFHVVADSGSVYFGSSADDHLTCLDAATGQVRWRYATEGPIRLAPVLAGGRVLVGSDDGCVHCVQASDGRPLWRQRVAPEDRRIPGNGRMVSYWPVRGGLVVRGDRVICGAGLFPPADVFLACLSIATGELIWRQVAERMPIEGYLLASERSIYAPTGRTPPAVYDASDGRLTQVMKGPGGAYALLAGDVLVSGPGRVETQLGASSAAEPDRMAVFRGFRLAVSGDTAYLAGKDTLSALDFGRHAALASSEPSAEAWRSALRWEVPSRYPFSLLLAGDTLFAGGQDEIAAFDAGDGHVKWIAPVEGRAEGLAAAHGRLWVSTDTGAVHCFGAMAAEAHAPVGPEPGASPTESSLAATVAEHILRLSGARQGFALVAGLDDGALACALARQSDLQVVCADPDAARVDRARSRLVREGLYGTRVSVHCVPLDRLPYAACFANLVVSESALGRGTLDCPAAEVVRVTRPEGGVACLGQSALPAYGGRRPERRLQLPALARWASADGDQGFEIRREAGLWAVLKRGALAGAGRWTHTYADPGNTACSGDSLCRGPMAVQWFGEPGPRAMVDRHHRTVPPLYGAGRLFVPGNECVFGVDAYNGTPLWRADLPGSRRVGIPRDAGSMTLADDLLYVASGSRCIGLDVASGEPRASLEAPRSGTGETLWGYVAVVGEWLYGTVEASGASRTGYGREVADEQYGFGRPIATSRALFCLNRHSGEPRWIYRGGRLPNPAIALGECVYLVESRAPGVLQSAEGQWPLETLLASDVHLVALDPATGQVVWDQAIALSEVKHAIHLQVCDGVVLVTGTSNDGGCAQYHLRAFSAADGRSLWQRDQASSLVGDRHGEEVQHPAIAGGIVYSNPFAYRLGTGEQIEGWVWKRDGGHGCGTLSAAAGTLFYRGANPQMRDLATQEIQALTRVSRPGCWINIVPAGGLVLIPEASSGCTCPYPLQMSLALAPAGP